MRFDDDAMQRRVLVRVKDCPEGEVVDALRDATIEFTTNTCCITNAAQVVTQAENTGVVTIDMTDFVLLDIVDAMIDGEKLLIVPANSDDLKDADATHPVIVYAGDVSSAMVVPTPDAPITVDLLVVVTLGPEAVEVPDFVWQRHYRALCDGAIALLLDQPKRPWSDAQTALSHRARFQAAINAAAMSYGANRLNTAQRLGSTPV
jgi:hypothetical protein